MNSIADLMCGDYENSGELIGYHFPGFEKISETGIIGYSSAIYMIRTHGAFRFSMDKIYKYSKIIELEDIPHQHKLTCVFLEDFSLPKEIEKFMWFIKPNSSIENYFSIGLEYNDKFQLNFKFILKISSIDGNYSISINPLGGFYVAKDL